MSDPNPPIPTPEAPPASSTFHAGERAIQRRLGVEEIEDWAKRVVRPVLPEQHRAFYRDLPFVVAAARDRSDRPWATLLVGREDAFVASPDPKSLAIAALPAAGDALADALAPGTDLGLLGIEFSSRRRNRVNGRVAARGVDGIHFEVGQSFGNCPQHIRERAWHRVDSSPAPTATRSPTLSAAQRAWIARADTFFIASGHRGEGEHAAFGMDASHRGGPAGFVTALGPNRLRFPDYSGNNHFNTLGNLALDPRAGLLFVDFGRGALLQLTGRAEIDWDSPEVARTPGARRLVGFAIEEVVEIAHAIPLRWREPETAALELRLVDKVRESADVTSFVFEAADGEPLPRFRAGQHLPIVLEADGLDGEVRRSYSLSGSPADAGYRISVKREPHGVASRFLHDRLEPGDVLRAGAPAGDFALDGAGPAVLVSAGVGATPMVSMLHERLRDDAGAPVWFVHGARDAAHHALADEVRALAERGAGVTLDVSFSRPRDDAEARRAGARRGRVDAETFERLRLPNAADYYVCGPTAFMADVARWLDARGVAPERVHTESFGPAA